MKGNLLKACFTLAITATIVISGCKYEDGPGVSMRSKRDRFANEWLIKSYTVGGEDLTSSFGSPSNDSGDIIMTTTRTGAFILLENPINAYEFDSVVWFNPTYIAMQALKDKMKAALGITKINLATQNGKWSFTDSHNKVRMGTELSNPNLYKEYEILELREDQLKIKYTDDNDTEHVITFTPLNDEDFFL
jgi:hypothetical protein